jgi:hypothetical protein
MSDKDITAGRRWREEIEKELEKAMFGIAIVTPENREEPWLLFECGALAKHVKESTVATYLFGLLPEHLLASPLHAFQACLANPDGPDGTLSLVASINEASEKPISEARLKETFDLWWPRLKAKLAGDELRQGEPSPPPPTDHELLGELLGIARGIADSMQSVRVQLATTEATSGVPGVWQQRAGRRGPLTFITGGNMFRDPAEAIADRVIDRIADQLERHNLLQNRIPISPQASEAEGSPDDGGKSP